MIKNTVAFPNMEPSDMPKRSSAHLQSAASVIDPAYCAEDYFPPREHHAGIFWLYGLREYSFYRHAQMREAVAQARLKVGYPGEFMLPASDGVFECRYAGGAGSFRCCGKARLSLDGSELPVIEKSGVCHFDCGSGLLRCTISSDSLPALCPDWQCRWSFRRGDRPGEKLPVEILPAGPDGNPPHLGGLPIFHHPLQRRPDGLFDAGREIFGRVVLTGLRPGGRIFVGESPAEARHNVPEDFEQNLSLRSDADGWRSVTPLAFRYLRLEPDQPSARVSVAAEFTPARYAGAFACPDRELNDIWMRAAYTLRLCTVNFMLDGLKRDRLPWSGDLRISLCGNAFVFGDREPIRRTLEVLGGAGIASQHINGITDYTLWYILNHDTFQRYFADPDFLRAEYAKITAVMDILHRQEDSHGFLPLNGWVFIDWLEMEKESSLQILYAAALRAAARLARRMDDLVHESCWQKRADTLTGRIMNVFYDRDAGLFRGGRTPGRYCRHANFLAVLAEMPADTERIASELVSSRLPATGTPYMAAMEIAALIRAGRRREALRKIRGQWGAMLQDGATTFYEAVIRPELPEEKRYGFYNRPFGMSLCHAWSAGPVSLLPELLFGVRPIRDGWAEFTLDIFPEFPEMSLAVPTPRGVIHIEYREGEPLSITAPPGIRQV